MANFFIDRPVFVWALTILLSLCGVLAIYTLPVEQYPELTPPKVRISTNYPGASAQTLENTVTQIIEQNMTGLDHLMYMSSQSNSTGSASVTLTFMAGTDPDKALQQVQNQLQPVMRKLPQAVQSQGVNVRKTGDANILTIAFVSVDGAMNHLEIADYVTSTIQEPLSRVSGVGDVAVYGSPYAMRIWLDPLQLTSYQLTTSDVISAIRAQNSQVSVGQLGATPAVKNQALNATVNGQSLLQTPSQFRAITLRVNPDGSAVTLGDVAIVELGAESYNFISRFNGLPASGLGIQLASGANEVATAKRVLAKLDSLAAYFPPGLEYRIAFETTSFVKASITDVLQTLFEAVLLVFLVMYLFLQNLRATLIPTIAVPVVLLGTFAVLYGFGYSINTLTMFAMVLAIGLLVDDAIVVVENVERIMNEEGLSAREATRKSMGQIQGALLGIALVLSAVFVPMAFFSGTTGAIYRQFSVTIVSAMVLSVLVAMILTPALCASLLRPRAAQRLHQTGFFGLFNRLFSRGALHYQRGIVSVLRHSLRWLLIYGLLLLIIVYLFFRLPVSFLPQNDAGVFSTSVQLPAGATQQQTLQVVKQIEDYYHQHEAKNIRSVFSIIGSGPGGNGQHVARILIRLKDWKQRDAQSGSSFAIIHRATSAFRQIKQAKVFASNPPVINGLGNAAGFEMQLEDHGGLGHDVLLQARDRLLTLANHAPQLMRVRHNGQDDRPQLQITVDQRKAQSLGLNISDINTTMQTAWGSSYINDFVSRERIKKVYVQAAAPYRMLPDDINNWYVRNNTGQMVPFSVFSSSRWESGPARLERHNGFRSLEIVGEAAPGVSTGTAMTVIAGLAQQLPAGIGFEWSGLSWQQQLAGAQTPLLYSISLLVVFLCLASLYESWSIPFAVMLAVPVGVLGALITTWLRGLENDIYFQVGLLTVVGLTAKNAILIVEFADTLHSRGRGLISATFRASQQRLRPIIMTSLAFIFGVLPMAISSGTGSASQHAVGTGVIGGMFTATFLAIFFVPLFYILVRRRFPLKKKWKQ